MSSILIILQTSQGLFFMFFRSKINTNVLLNKFPHIGNVIIEDDVEIEEFSDVLEDWIIDSLKAIGCDTARSVMALSAEDLVLRTDLEKETVDEILDILSSEFED